MLAPGDQLAAIGSTWAEQPRSANLSTILSVRLGGMTWTESEIEALQAESTMMPAEALVPGASVTVLIGLPDRCGRGAQRLAAEQQLDARVAGQAAGGGAVVGELEEGELVTGRARTAQRPDGQGRGRAAAPLDGRERRRVGVGVAPTGAGRGAVLGGTGLELVLVRRRAR